MSAGCDVAPMSLEQIASGSHAFEAAAGRLRHEVSFLSDLNVLTLAEAEAAKREAEVAQREEVMAKAATQQLRQAVAAQRKKLRVQDGEMADCRRAALRSREAARRSSRQAKTLAKAEAEAKHCRLEAEAAALSNAAEVRRLSQQLDDSKAALSANAALVQQLRQQLQLNERQAALAAIADRPRAWALSAHPPSDDEQPEVASVLDAAAGAGGLCQTMLGESAQAPELVETLAFVERQQAAHQRSHSAVKRALNTFAACSLAMTDPMEAAGPEVVPPPILLEAPAQKPPAAVWGGYLPNRLAPPHNEISTPRENWSRPASGGGYSGFATARQWTSRAAPATSRTPRAAPLSCRSPPNVSVGAHCAWLRAMSRRLSIEESPLGGGSAAGCF
eukprot:TRINITY_DN93216_c0_g1_i1.p1 TRINITY_DN93216_c0_g1~~TRINITY_DN93216_c0_g1_i1.p1  ORF type:complete len:390 (-),score=88.88 TRINITY_DN93216_c0_g1_i1:78-1247(-)